MTDESAEPEHLSEAATPGRSLRGAAEDLSSLFGQDYEPDPGATALGPRRPAGGIEERLGRSLEAVTQRLAFIESELAGTVERVQSVDRHLASTYQALQAVLEQMAQPGDDAAGAGGTVDLAPLEYRLDTLATDVGRSLRGLRDQIDSLRGRLMSFEGGGGSPALEDRLSSVEVSLNAVAGRLARVEDRVVSTLSHAESSRDGLARLERSVDALREVVGGGGDPVPRERPDTWSSAQDRAEPTGNLPASMPDTPVLEDPLLAQFEETAAAGTEPSATVEEIPEASLHGTSPPEPAEGDDAEDALSPPETTPFWSSPGGS